MRAIACAAALLLLDSAIFAQTATTTNLPKFDVVSIKPHKDEGLSRIGIRFQMTPDGVLFNGGSPDMLLHFAFDVPRDRLLDEPEWVKSSRFDIEAKVAPEDAPSLEKLTRQQRWAMMIPVLEDRCQLKFHHESRELPVYTLMVASGGPKLTGANPADSDASKPGSAGEAQPARSPMMMSISSKGMTIQGRDATIDSLIEMLSQQIGTTVVDNTGFTGKYNFTLSWMPDEDWWQLMGIPIPGPPPESGGQSQQPTGPSIFTALKEQLGLKLEMHKKPVDVIVIDHMEEPSAN